MIHWKEKGSFIVRCGADCGRGHEVKVETTPNQDEATCTQCKRLPPYKSTLKVHFTDYKRIPDEYGEYIYGVCGTATAFVDNNVDDASLVTCKRCLQILENE